MNNEKAKLRKYEDDLNIGGIGVVILGAWDIMKVATQTLMESKSWFDIETSSADEKTITVIVIVALIALFLLLCFLIFRIHLYIGVNASRAAKGQPYKKGYYVGAVILLVLTILSLAVYIDEFRDLERIPTIIASIIVDVTSIYILGVVVISTRRIRELRMGQIQE